MRPCLLGAIEMHQQAHTITNLFAFKGMGYLFEERNISNTLSNYTLGTFWDLVIKLNAVCASTQCSKLGMLVSQKEK